MAVLALPVYRFLYQGAPASNGTITVYQTGTTTPVTIYTDAALSVPASNPITLDSNGECKFYVGTSLALRLDVKTSGATLIETIDPAYPVVDFSGFSGTGTDLNKIVGITNGIAAANKALVPDSGLNVSGINTETADTASTKIANMAAVQASMIGGFVNRFYNPAMDLFQRGGGGTITAGTSAYTADGWIVGCSGVNVTWATGGGIGKTYNSLRITGALGATDMFVKQRIESYNSCIMEGRLATVQAKIYNNTGATFTPTITIKHTGSQDSWGSPVTDINAQALQPCPNAVSTIVAYTFTADTLTGNGLEVTFDFGTALNANSALIQISELDIRATPGVTSGQNTKPPVPELPSPAYSYLCSRRYLPARLSASTTDPIASGMCITTTTAKIVVPFDVPARISPTGITISNATDFSLRKSDGTLQACTALAFVQASRYACELLATVGSAVLTAGNATELIFNSASGSIIFTGAEL